MDFNYSSRSQRGNGASLNELLQDVRDFMRMQRMSPRTEATYLLYIERFLRFHGKKPLDMGAPEIESYLTHMAAREHVAAATQNLAFNALFFSVASFYKSKWKTSTPCDRNGQSVRRLCYRKAKCNAFLPSFHRIRYSLLR